MTSEVIAALAKLMGNLDLMYVSRKLHIEATCNTTIGKKEHLQYVYNQIILPIM